MRFLNFIAIDPVSFMKSLEQTADVEILNKIQDLTMELENSWKEGIPKYKGKLSLSSECIEAKKELLAALMNEYQLRRCLGTTPIHDVLGNYTTTAASRTLKQDVKLKDGRTYTKGTSVEVKFFGDKDNGHKVCEINVMGSTDMSTTSFKTAIANLPKFVSGFTKPSLATMEKWVSEGIAKTPTGKRTEPDGYADDGSPSWLLVLGYI
jgi:hypothetical protein